MHGKLVIISAPSGAGKTTIVKYLLEHGLNLEFSISATTRKIRGDETNGKEYFFLTVEEFRRKIDNGDFAEWEEVYKDHYYGTLKSEIERIWNDGKHVLFDVDVRGGINLKRIFGKKAISIFIKPPSVSELEKRLMKRGTDSEEKIKMRVMKAEEEMKSEASFDYVVINDCIAIAQSEVFNLVRNFINAD